MNSQFKAENALLRILCSDDPADRVPNGGGVLVGARHALTCFHVVKDVMAGDRVWFDFSHIEGSAVFEAVVVESDEVADVALLEVVPNEHWPEQAMAARFMQTDGDWFEKAAHVCGFPKEIDPGDWVKGCLVGESGGLIQMDLELTSKAVKKGFSGCPVWIDGKQRAAGLMVKSYCGDGERSGYVIPVRTLTKFFPDLVLEPAAKDEKYEDQKGEADLKFEKDLQGVAVVTGDGNMVNLNYIDQRGTGKGGDSAEAVRKARETLPVPHAEIVDPPTPGGAVSPDSGFYVKRPADDAVDAAALKHRGMASIRAPRQDGKTSLLKAMRRRLNANGAAVQIALVDFQILDSDALQSTNMAWAAVAQRIAMQLKLLEWTPDRWDSRFPVDRNLSDFIESFVFRSDDRPLVLCLDEADRLLESNIANDLFGKVRALFNEGADDDLWSRVRWVICSSSEPAFFIKDAYQSPFLIGEKVTLEPFTRAETESLAAAYGLELGEERQNRIGSFLGGRPYLVHFFLHNLAQRDPANWDALFDAGGPGAMLFRDHLARYQRQFQQEPDLARAMKQVIRGKGVQDLRMADRLEAAGLARMGADFRLECACELYAKFFEGVL
jgi:hypothetical protein